MENRFNIEQKLDFQPGLGYHNIVTIFSKEISGCLDSRMF